MGKDKEERLHVKDVAGHPMAMGALGALVGVAAGSVVGKLTSPDLVGEQFVNDVAQALRLISHGLHPEHETRGVA